MLIRAEDGSIINLDHVDRIVKSVPAGSQNDCKILADFSGPHETRTLAAGKTEEEAEAIMQRIMFHTDGNLDLME
jgi:hypothetical protein